MALSTTDLGTGGSGMAKTIAPGNHTLKINGIFLEDFTFIEGAKHLIIHVETEPIEGFEGFLIDKDDESKGRHAGQIGRIKASQYAYVDSTTKTGIKVERDRSVLMFLQTLCKALDINDWFVEQDGQHETIDDFIAGFNKTAPFKDKYLEFCVAGKEYLNKSGYTTYDMWLPKAENRKYAFGDVETGKVITYDEAKHLKKLEVKEVKGFGDDSDDFSMPTSSSDFSLD
jgi:hypothetical protein